MKTIILAGGKGTRLKPYTTVIPKPLVPVGETAIIEILIKQLKKYGIEEIEICLGHFAEIIMAFLGDGKKFGLKITYSLEETPMGTVAPIKLLRDLPENFLVMNGDLLTNLNFKDLFDAHLKNESLLTVSTYQRNTKIDFGVIETEANSEKVCGFKEKPEYNFEVSMGVYAMNRKILEYIPDNQHFGFDNLMLTLLEKKQNISIYRFNGYWLDIGRPEDYERANNDVEKLNL
jgi:NDP-sugar pyrophosphorylase family protein